MKVCVPDESSCSFTYSIDQDVSLPSSHVASTELEGPSDIEDWTKAVSLHSWSESEASSEGKAIWPGIQESGREEQLIAMGLLEFGSDDEQTLENLQVETVTDQPEAC